MAPGPTRDACMDRRQARPSRSYRSVKTSYYRTAPSVQTSYYRTAPSVQTSYYRTAPSVQTSYYRSPSRLYRCRTIAPRRAGLPNKSGRQHWPQPHVHIWADPPLSTALRRRTLAAAGHLGVQWKPTVRAVPHASLMAQLPTLPNGI